MPSTMQEGGATEESRVPLQDQRIFHAGQYVAMVVAERAEQARDAASLLKIVFQHEPHAVALDGAAETKYRPSDFMGESLQLERGNVAEALERAEVRLDETYSTPNAHACALEPHACITSWSDGVLTVYNSTQWIMGDRTVLQAAFGLPPEKVRVLCPYLGGMFGSKGAVGAHILLAAIAARRLGRPVKVVLSRTQVLLNVGHRSETVQRFEIGAKRDGSITAMRHHITTHTSVADEFAEPVSICTRMLYDIPNYETIHELVRLNVMKPSWMRAPGEAPGQYGIESALDELSYQLKMDPVELRRRNHAVINPNNKKPFSSKHLLDCYERGAERFGWSSRKPQPRSMYEGNALIGWGMATATYPAYRMGADVSVRLQREPDGVRAYVSTAGSDVGTGLYTMLTITAADHLGLPLERVTVTLGDSELPRCAVAGGSNLTASTAPAAADACSEIKRQLLQIASETADGFTGAQEHVADFLFSDGRLAHRSAPQHSIGYADLMSLGRRESIDAQGSTEPIFGQNDQYAFQSFGAHFVEVRVREKIGRVRVSRIVSVFDCGRILSAKTARSQFLGGIVFGIGHALLEEIVYDREHGQSVNAGLASYLVPVNADVPEIDVSWVGEPDFNFNPIGCRGIGEIGITGVAAAIANGVYHATGVRVRDLPITPDKLL
jgi:xanthine dehydrogenase YagR molybdenum-binding subunit